MYSTIFQIETSPVSNDERITANDYDYDHWFVNSIADLIVDDNHRSSTIEWLKETLSAAEPYVEYFTDGDNEGFILREGFQAAYFANKFEEFQHALQRLVGESTLSAYSQGELDMYMFELQSNYSDKYGAYVENCENGLCRLNDFLRRADIDVRYYFGGTVLYHI